MTESDKHGKTRDDAPDDAVAAERVDSGSDERDAVPESGPDESAGDDVDSASGEPAGGSGQDAGGRRSRPARSGFLVWLAMLTALASLGLASYPFWSQWLNPRSAERAGPSASEFEQIAGRVDTMRQDTDAEIEDLRDRLDRLASAEIRDLSERVDRLASDVQSEPPGPDAGMLAERIDQLSARIERLQGERNTGMGGLRTRLEELEGKVGRRLEQFELKLSNVGSDLDRADHDLATRLLLIEVDSLFAIARNHVVLGENPGVARQAWARAMERLTALDGTEFQELKETARREFGQLQNYQPPDAAGKVERLFAMADAVAAWPARTLQPGEAPAEDPGAGKGWRSRLGQVVGSLVRVESVDRDFLGPDEVDLARERVSSTLQTAGLAMVRARPDLARRLLGEAADAAQRVFDTEAANVSDALSWLEKTAASSSQAEPPELGDSRAEISRLLGEMR